MNRQGKIDFIYEKIADKTLSFWCIIRRETGVWDILDFKIIQNRLIKFENWKTRREIQLYHSNSNQVWLYNELDDKEIIWHPVMIWDVLKWIDKNCVNWVLTCSKCGSEVWYEDWIAYCSDWDCDNDKFEDFKWLYKTNLSIEFYDINTKYVNDDNFLWQKLDKPIEDQSDECINFVYDIINKKK